MTAKLDKMPSSSKFGLERSASSCGRVCYKNRHRLDQERFSERKSSLLGGIVRVLAAELATRIDIDWIKKDFRNENHHY
ncbi:hypothetical protein [Pediococcus parvulus]|uniref:hypothetical protein n=1 Tax=Pediococcus parvulus TaxID=54062 RepID=UPI001679EEDE|nr:hypothetical protein [Pediococcus parvulus]